MSDDEYMYMASKLSDEINQMQRDFNQSRAKADKLNADLLDQIEMLRSALEAQMNASLLLMARLDFSDQEKADCTSQARSCLELVEQRRAETVGEWTTRIQGWPPVLC